MALTVELSVTPTELAAPAVMSPTVIHLVSDPSDDNICPLLPNPSSPSLTSQPKLTLPLNVVSPEKVVTPATLTLSRFV